MTSSASYPFCIATVVTTRAIEAMLEAGGGGNYRDEHPWLIAAEMLEDAGSRQQALPVLFATLDEEGGGIWFSHWSTIDRLEVVELHRGQWATRCHFHDLRPVNPIFEPVDSVFLKASDEQMAREQREGIRVHRQALDEHQIHPYAICETPAYIAEALSDSD